MAKLDLSRWRTAVVGAETIDPAARIRGTAKLTDEPLSVRDGWLIGHGRPAPEHGVELTIVDESGAPLPEGHLGEIVVAGPSVTWQLLQAGELPSTAVVVAAPGRGGYSSPISLA